MARSRQHTRLAGQAPIAIVIHEQLGPEGIPEPRDGKHFITPKGKEAAGEFRMSPTFGPYFLWPEVASMVKQMVAQPSRLAARSHGGYFGSTVTRGIGLGS